MALAERRRGADKVDCARTRAHRVEKPAAAGRGDPFGGSRVGYLVPNVVAAWLAGCCVRSQFTKKEFRDIVVSGGESPEGLREGF